MTDKRTRGRPSEYDPTIIDLLLEHAANGLSLVQISAKINIPRTTLISWGEAHPEFSTVLKRAKELEQAWWEDTGIQALWKGKEFKGDVWARSMQARFRNEYTERRQTELSGQIGTFVVEAPPEPATTAEWAAKHGGGDAS
jgi:hypothetical protein